MKIPTFLPLRIEHLVAIVMCSSGYLAGARVVREGVWQNYAAWEKSCQVQQLSTRQGDEEIEMVLNCGDRVVRVVNDANSLRFLFRKTSTFKCSQSKMGAIKCRPEVR